MFWKALAMSANAKSCGSQGEAEQNENVDVAQQEEKKKKKKGMIILILSIRSILYLRLFTVIPRFLSLRGFNTIATFGIFLSL